MSQTDKYITVQPDGPYLVHGGVPVLRGGEVVTEEQKYALCRCGQSQNKPMCDGSHARVGFRAE